MRWSIALCLLLSSCASPRSSLPRIAELYSEAAKSHTRNPVIVIHGLLGARLEERSSKRTVWGAFTSEGIDPNSPEGVRALGLPLRAPGSALDYDPDIEEVYPAGPLEALKLDLLVSGLSVSVEVYANIIRTLGAGGYTDNVVLDPFSPAYSEDHFTCFTFFYDWRRDNVENAIRLGHFIDEKRVEIGRAARKKIVNLRATGDPADLEEASDLEAWLARGYRFDIVAHSMGGLVSRYFLRYGANDLPSDGSVPPVTWAGAVEVDRLIMVGTPNLGAMESLNNLVNGFSPSVILPTFHQTLIATMASIYQLMPRARHGLVEGSDVDLFDVEVWDRNGWGLLDPDGAQIREWLLPDVAPAERRAVAKQYLSWCLARAAQFHAALDQRPTTPCRARVYLFAADTEDTITRTRVVERDGRLVPTFDDADLYGPGDVTVPRYSAVADERAGRMKPMWLDTSIPWTNVTFLADDHIGLTSNPHFSNNTLFVLLEQAPPRR